MQAKFELHDQIQEGDQFTGIAHQSDTANNTQRQQHNQYHEEHKQKPQEQQPGHSPSNQSLVADDCYQIAPLSLVAPPVVLAPALKPLPSPLDDQEGAFLDAKSTTPIHYQHEIGSHHRPTLNPPPSTPLTPHLSQHIAEKPQAYLNPSAPLLPTPQSAWRRRLSKTRSLITMKGSVKRSASSPNVPQVAAMAEGPGGAPYSTEKRRNKLGYHRTSVACGHCRHRKIRCLLAKGDLKGRCSNCIRLKKECNFYPVENNDKRPRSLSKPDLSTQDTGSSTSSPSPGLRMGQLSGSDAPAGYPVSVPVTPTYDFGHGTFDDCMRHGSLSSTSDRLSATNSTTVSRRPSLAQLHPMPLNVKGEQGYLAPRDSFPRPGWELASQMDPATRFSEQNRAMEDPSTAFWRLAASPMTNTFPSQSLSSMPSLNSLDSSEHDNHSWHSQAPSRMGSIDQDMNGFAYKSGYYSDAGIYSGTPEMYSASASTSSLTASISDNSQYGGEARPGQFYMSQWPNKNGILNHFDVDDTHVKQESFESHPPFYVDDSRYGPVADDSTLLFQSPLQSPTVVGMSSM
ncbi:hypothetical protein RUND412_006876 [Rhizina undulata]